MDWRDRLQQRIDALGLTRLDVSRRAGVGPTAIRDIVDRGQTPSVENLAKIARAVGMTLTELYEGDKRVDILLRVNGVTTGQSMWAELHGRHQKVVPLTVFDDDTVGVEVSTDNLLPSYRRGDILCGPRSSGAAASNLAGLDCIIQTSDGERYIGILTLGQKPGQMDIRSFDPRQDGRRNAPIEWVAPIRLILRGR